MQSTCEAEQSTRAAIVLSGGGGHGACAAGGLSYLFEHIYPKLRSAVVPRGNFT